MARSLLAQRAAAQCSTCWRPIAVPIAVRGWREVCFSTVVLEPIGASAI
jgi:hypothetical protein